jgi:hypothetical protein
MVNQQRDMVAAEGLAKTGIQNTAGLISRAGRCEAELEPTSLSLIVPLAETVSRRHGKFYLVLQ